jgi:DNA gyrase/topoisomerase IV subunit B
MSNYNTSNIQILEWHEAIRKRPQMYIGWLEPRGFVGILKSTCEFMVRNVQCESILLEIKGEHSASLVFEKLQAPIENVWSGLQLYYGFPFSAGFYALNSLNALSSRFKVNVFNGESEVYSQIFHKGISQIQPIQKYFIGDKLEFRFELDKEFWDENLKLNGDFITYHLRETSFFYPKTEFHLKYLKNNQNCKLLFNFEDGLKDKLNIDYALRVGNLILQTHSSISFENYHLEFAFGFNEYSVDESILRSYVNDDYTSKDGTHVYGFLNGITSAIGRFIENHAPEFEGKAFIKNVDKSLVALINLRIENPVYEGSVKNKLKN